MFTSRPMLWLRSHPQTADALFAALITGISLAFHFTVHGEGIHDPSLTGALLTVGATAPIALRRRWPIPVLLVVLVFQGLVEALNYAGPGWAGALIALYTVGSLRSSAMLRRLATVLLPLLMAFIIWGVVRGDAPWQAIVSAPVMFLGALILGDNMRRRRLHVAELAERAERVEREQVLRSNQHVQEERARIARELHDVVAHSVSLMIIQTAAARRQMTKDPVRAEEALLTVEETGRTAMTEMRRILGVLRDEAGGGELEPQPSLADVAHIVEAAPDLPVMVHTSGDLSSLPAGVELSAYRVVQEALTNVRRHAGPVQQVDVSLTRNDVSLTVEVVDDGRGASAAPNAGGFGIVGMKERVAAYDGGLLAGPRPGGGWRVKAVFPVVAR